MLDDATVAERRDPRNLKAIWAEHRAANPKQRIRDAAAALGVSPCGAQEQGARLRGERNEDEKVECARYPTSPHRSHYDKPPPLRQGCGGFALSASQDLQRFPRTRRLRNAGQEPISTVVS